MPQESLESRGESRLNSNSGAPNTENITFSSSSSSSDRTTNHPPPRMHLSTPKENFEHLASRTVSQAISEEGRAIKIPASPLDSISPSLYPRFPRFSITTESSHPDLSTDEVISTKISSDEEGMVAQSASPRTIDTRSSKRQRLKLRLHRAVSTPILGLRQIGNRIKQAPNSNLARRVSKTLHRSVSESQAQAITEQTETSLTSDHPRPSHGLQTVLQSKDVNRPTGAGPPDGISSYGRNKLSDLPEDQTADNQNARPQNQPMVAPQTPCPPLSERNVFRYGVGPSLTTLNSYHTAREQIPRRNSAFLGRTSSWSKPPNNGLPRSISLGSIDELRSNSFMSTQQRVFSVPTVPSRRSSLVGSACSTPRQSPRIVGVCDVDDLSSLSQLRREPMFVDIQEGHEVNFVFPAKAADVQRPSSSPLRPSIGPKSKSYRSLRQPDSSPLLVRSSGIKSGLEQTNGQKKIPLFVPSHIIKPAAGKFSIPGRQSSRPVQDGALSVGDAAHDNERYPKQENPSKETLSEESDWSTTVQFEAHKEEIFEAKSETSAVQVGSGPCKQTPQVGEFGESEAGRNFEGTTLDQGRSDARSPDTGYMEGSPGATRTGRVVQRWDAYLHRVKRHIWKKSDHHGKDV
jgi:hypothetical protein